MAETERESNLFIMDRIFLGGIILKQFGWRSRRGFMPCTFLEVPFMDEQNKADYFWIKFGLSIVEDYPDEYLFWIFSFFLIDIF